jgi:chemotaxis protein CheC
MAVLNNTEFNEDQIDILKEFMNIAIGEATSHIAELLGAFGTMHIPSVTVRDSRKLKEIIIEKISPDKNYYVMQQLFTGKFAGECLFIVDETSAINLGSHLYENDEVSRDEINDAVMELTNIVTSTIISRLTDELSVRVQFFVPSSNFVKVSDIINYETDQYSTVIVVSTMLEFKDQNIHGYIFILTKDEAINSLKELIDQKLEELYSE